MRLVDVANATGITDTRLSRIERGEGEPASLEEHQLIEGVLATRESLQRSRARAS